MRFARRLIVLFFVVTTIGFAVYTLKDRVETDAAPPVISAASDTLETTVDAGDETLLAGMTAQDDRDGDVTGSLVVVSKSKFVEKGTLRVNYAAFDAQGNVGTYTRTVTYTDYTSPRFTLNTPLRVNATAWSDECVESVGATDCIDGNISGLIKYRYDDDDYIYGETGEMAVTFQVTNSAGDTVQLDLTVDVLSEEDYQERCPELTTYLVYTQVGRELDLEGYLRESAYFEADQVDIDDQVDYDTPGVYQAVYTLRDEDGERQGSVTLFVVVEE